mmetsp:Transcript_11778/g.14941  ORF Transcript_11778/g.14941 Transcript_11778/m.14941 type:complete len:90 (+) Transcript_11778:3030-3299(+)
MGCCFFTTVYARVSSFTASASIQQGVLISVLIIRSTLQMLVGLDEDLLKGGHRDAVTQDIQLIHSFIKLSKEIFELRCLLVINLEGNFL